MAFVAKDSIQVIQSDVKGWYVVKWEEVGLGKISREPIFLNTRSKVRMTEASKDILVAELYLRMED